MHVRDLQQIIRVYGLERFGGQRHDFQDAVLIYPAHVLQPHLVYLLEAVAFPVLPVYVLYVIELFALIPCGAGIVDDAQRNVRLHCQQPAVQVGESQHFITCKKVPVSGIEGILLEFAYLVFLIAVLLIKASQLQSSPLVRLQIVLHIYSPSGFCLIRI